MIGHTRSRRRGSERLKERTAEARGGPRVFLLSQSRLANPDTAAAEVARLATFLEVSPGNEQMIARAQSAAANAIADVTMLEAERQSMASQANGKNACCLKQELAARNGLDKSDRMHANFVEISIPTYSIYVYLSI